MSKGIPVHPTIFGTNAANLNLEQTSAKQADVLPLDNIILNYLIVNSILTQNILTGKVFYTITLFNLVVPTRTVW